MSLIPNPGSEYWSRVFGITSYDDFKAAATPLIDGPFPHLGFLDDALLKSAWQNPFQPSGLVISAGLTAAGFHEDSPSGHATVVVTSLGELFGKIGAEETAMSGLVIPDCFQVTIQMVCGGHAIENVVGVENASGTAAAAGAAVKTAWEIATGPLSILSNLVAMVNYHAVDISSLTGTIADVPSTATGGAGAATLSTRAACALVKWNGGNRSRSTRGRLYHGPIAETTINSDGATIPAASITNITTAYTAFRNSLSTSGYPLVVLSRTLSIATPVTAHAVENTVATQRRRLRS